MGDATKLEIERKFLVRDRSCMVPGKGLLYRQGYLSRDPRRQVRVRIAGDKAFLTIKGPVVGISRSEYEYPIPLADAEALLGMVEGPLVEKLRYPIFYGGKTWEVDQFLGSNEGLDIAEVELLHEAEPVDLPPWVGREVTGHACLGNVSLSEHPFKTWSPKEKRWLLENNC